MKIPRREACRGNVVERHGVIDVDGEHRVRPDLAGSISSPAVKFANNVALNCSVSLAMPKSVTFVVAHGVGEREGVGTDATGEGGAGGSDHGTGYRFRRPP
jgi:hypothetical protein